MEDLVTYQLGVQEVGNHQKTRASERVINTLVFRDPIVQNPERQILFIGVFSK